MNPYRDSFEHIRDEMLRLDLLLRRALIVARATAEQPQTPEYRGIVISEPDIDEMLRGSDFFGEHWRRESAESENVKPIDQQLATLRSAIDARRTASQQEGTRLALAHLAQQFALSEAEVDLVLIALAPELEPRYETLYAYLQDDVTRKRPSVNLALNLICRSEREKLFARRLLSPGAPLLHFQLLQLEDELQDRSPLFARRFLKLADPVVRFLFDEPPSALESGVVAMPEPAAAAELSEESRAALDGAIESILRSGLGQSVVRLRGDDPPALDAAAQLLAAALDRGILRFDLAQLEAEPARLVTAIRDAALYDALLAVSAAAPVSAEPGTRISRAEARLWSELQRVQDPVALLGPETAVGNAPAGSDLRVWPIDIAPPGFESRVESWSDALSAAGASADAESLADTFRFGRSRIRQSVNLAFSRAALRDASDPRPNQEDFVAAARSLSTPNLGRFAVQVTPRSTFADIVLPAEKMAQLHSIVTRVRYRRRVYDVWGFGAKLSRGKGNIALFTGPPGTGKTMAAEAIANQLGLNLLQIDLSSVVSKYIGETESNLNVIFREAENTQTLLFFDEADALFGKRTEVKDAHDRYANLETNYLLQRVEQYEGLVILASNMQSNMDEAFLRRTQEVVEFPLPDDASREQIWRRHFPPGAPVEPDIDFPFLARQFKLAGGEIKNVVMAAAFAAAEENAAIGMPHLVTALRGEVLKKGRLVMKNELGKYFELAVSRSARPPFEEVER